MNFLCRLSFRKCFWITKANVRRAFVAIRLLALFPVSALVNTRRGYRHHCRFAQVRLANDRILCLELPLRFLFPTLRRRRNRQLIFPLPSIAMPRIFASKLKVSITATNLALVRKQWRHRIANVRRLEALRMTTNTAAEIHVVTMLGIVRRNSRLAAGHRLLALVD